jgi:hypothetical protein
MSEPTLRLLSLGAGVQSTTLALLAVEGVLPKPDAAVFADTGNEPAAVYDHLARLEQILDTAGIPTHRVSVGHIVADTLMLLDNTRHLLARPAGWFASMPLYVQSEPGPCQRCATTGRVPDPDKPGATKKCGRCRGTGWDDGKGQLPRQCTADYKLDAVKAQTRALLTGSPHARVPASKWAEAWIGFSTDEVGRVKPSDVRYQRLRHPLLDLRMSRKDCQRWLDTHGWPNVPKSACVVCPLHGNRMWRDMRDNRPVEWELAVAFDRQLRDLSVYTHGRSATRGQVYLHRSRVPLDQAPIDHVTRTEWLDRQGDLFDLLAEEGDPDGCSPYGCRSGVAVA